MEKKSEDVSTYSFVIDLLERTPMVGLIKSLYHYLRKDTEKCKVCLKKQMKFYMNMFKVIPGIGHLIGVFCYIFGWKETGDLYIKYSSRTILCAAFGAIYGYYSNLSLKDLFKLQSLKHIAFCSLISISVGCLFDYANSFVKTIYLTPKNPDEKQILFVNNTAIKVNFPFGVTKSYRKLREKPHKKIKYGFRLWFQIGLLGAFGLCGFYYCLKVEEDLYSYVYGEVKKYAVYGSLALLCFL